MTFEPVTTLVDKSYTVSYYPEYESWLCFHDYKPSVLFNTDRSVISISNQGIYQHNRGAIGYYYNRTYRSSVTPVFTSPYIDKGHSYPARYYNINWVCDIKNEVRLLTSTADFIYFYNSYQSTGEIDIIEYDSSKTLIENYDTYNVIRIKNYWNFNKFRDLVTNRNLDFIDNVIDEDFPKQVSSNLPYYDKRPFIDNYLVIKLGFNNERSENFYLYEINCETQFVRSI